MLVVCAARGRVYDWQCFFFLLCARVGEKVSSLHVYPCVPFRAGVEDALEQQREFDEHVIESKRYAY